MPNVKNKEDISYIDRDFTNEAPKETFQDSSALQSTHIDGFSYAPKDAYLFPNSDNWDQLRSVE